MKDEEEKKIQNQEDEVLNTQEEATIEGGVSDIHEDVKFQEDGAEAGCNCICE